MPAVVPMLQDHQAQHQFRMYGSTSRPQPTTVMKWLPPLFSTWVSGNPSLDDNKISKEITIGTQIRQTMSTQPHDGVDKGRLTSTAEKPMALMSTCCFETLP
jgi:hypothetical protein